MARAAGATGGPLTTLLVTPEELRGDELRISGDAYRHLFRAKRLSVGGRLRLVDGEGRARWGRVSGVEGRSATAELAGAAPANELARRIDLLVARPRAARASWLVEKATELGVYAVRFLRCARGQRGHGPATLARLGRVARAAVEQAHRARVPELSGPHPWPELGGLVEAGAELWVLDPSAGEVPRSPPESAVALAVGPEGGWTSQERRDLLALGCRAIALGPATLRIETAALAAVAWARRD